MEDKSPIDPKKEEEKKRGLPPISGRLQVLSSPRATNPLAQLWTTGMGKGLLMTAGLIFATGVLGVGWVAYHIFAKGDFSVLDVEKMAKQFSSSPEKSGGVRGGRGSGLDLVRGRLEDGQGAALSQGQADPKGAPPSGEGSADAQADPGLFSKILAKLKGSQQPGRPGIGGLGGAGGTDSGGVGSLGGTVGGKGAGSASLDAARGLFRAPGAGRRGLPFLARLRSGPKSAAAGPLGLQGAKGAGSPGTSGFGAAGSQGQLPGSKNSIGFGAGPTGFEGAGASVRPDTVSGGGGAGSPGGGVGSGPSASGGSPSAGSGSYKMTSKDCEAQGGVYDSATKYCDMTPRRKKECEMQGGIFDPALKVCDSTPVAKAKCESEGGVFDGTTKLCDKSRLGAETCDQNGGVWNDTSKTCDMVPVKKAQCEAQGGVFNVTTKTCDTSKVNAEKCAQEGGIWNNAAKSCDMTLVKKAQCEAQGGVFNSATKLCDTSKLSESGCGQGGGVWDNVSKTCDLTRVKETQCKTNGGVFDPITKLCDTRCEPGTIPVTGEKTGAISCMSKQQCTADPAFCAKCIDAGVNQSISQDGSSDGQGLSSEVQQRLEECAAGAKLGRSPDRIEECFAGVRRKYGLDSGGGSTVSLQPPKVDGKSCPKMKTPVGGGYGEGGEDPFDPNKGLVVRTADQLLVDSCRCKLESLHGEIGGKAATWQELKYLAKDSQLEGEDWERAKSLMKDEGFWNRVIAGAVAGGLLAAVILKFAGPALAMAGPVGWAAIGGIALAGILGGALIGALFGGPSKDDVRKLLGDMSEGLEARVTETLDTYESKLNKQFKGRPELLAYARCLYGTYDKENKGKPDAQKCWAASCQEIQNEKDRTNCLNIKPGNLTGTGTCEGTPALCEEGSSSSSGGGGGGGENLVE